MADTNKNFSFNLSEFEIFLNDVNNPVFLIDNENNILFINHSAEKFTNYSCSEITGRHFSNISDEIVSSDIEKIQSLKKINIRKKNGDTVKLAFSLYNTESNFHVLLLHLLDSNDGTSSNENLLEIVERSYDFLQSVMDYANPIIVIDPSGFIILINKSFLIRSGFLSSEIIGKKIGEILSADIISIFSKNEEEIAKAFSGILYCEAEMIKKNGEKAFVELSMNPLINNGSVVSVVCSLNDITEKKKDGEKINKLLLAIENSPATVIITDSSGKIEYVNSKFSSLTGYSIEESIGMNPSILKSGTQNSGFYKDLWDTILSGNEWRGEFHNKKKDGSLYWEFASISPMKNTNNEITNFVAVKEDVTERKIIEENLRIGEEKLRKKNQSMQQDLNYAQLIIKNILPSEPPEWERLKVQFKYIPLDTVGGDFFWFYNLPDGSPAVYLGDVSGHGVSAALFLSMVKTVSDMLLPKYGYNPGKYMHALNRDLYNNMFSYFITALYGVFDFSSENVKFKFSKGGHQPPIIYRKNENKVFSITSKGKPIALFKEDYFNEITVILNKGDRIFLYTDGLVEVSNESMEMLDQAGLENIIMANNSFDLNKSLEYILDAVNNFMGTNKAQDDIILIAVELI
jgi:PAS domain S-box-containing protein